MVRELKEKEQSRSIYSRVFVFRWCSQNLTSAARKRQIYLSLDMLTRPTRRPVRFVMSVPLSLCPSVCVFSAPTGRISVKFVQELDKNRSRTTKFGQIQTKISGILHKYPSTFCCCRRHKFAVNLSCTTPSIFIFSTVTCNQALNTETLLRFHCKVWKRERPTFNDMRTLTILFKFI